MLPVLERLKETWPERPVLLTFFSPSSHHARRPPLATHVGVPACGYRRERAQVRGNSASGPGALGEYDFWHHHLSRLHQARAPLSHRRLSGGQPFFRWFRGQLAKDAGALHPPVRPDERSQELLEGDRCHNVTVSGDTRFDR